MREPRRLFIFIIISLALLTAPACKIGSGDKLTYIKAHTISIELFPAEHAFRVRDEMQISHGSMTLSLFLNRNFLINSVMVNGRRADFRFADLPEEKKKRKYAGDSLDTDFSRAGIISIPVKPAGRFTVVIDYSGKVYEEPAASEFSREYIANQTAGIISESGTFLSPEAFWYPRGDEMISRFDVSTATPAWYETVTQGTRLKHEVVSGLLKVRWKNDHPADALYLQAGPYEVKEGDVDGIKVYTYFYKESSAYSSLYLKKSIEYIALYNKLLGRYPYGKFAVVENFFETGYGMPSWTLLGSAVIRLPFIPDTSLPHEICHNWWGNGVFVHYAKGNWCEGLTMYCADYLLKKRSASGEDVEYRRQVLRDYASYVREQNELPLVAFRSRHNPAERAVGYGKAMMVFHDLHQRVGEEKFFDCLRRLMSEYAFKIASWHDVLGVFERECRIKLDRFYQQWVERPGAPVIRLRTVRLFKQENGFLVQFAIDQEGEPYDLNVSLSFTTIGGVVQKTVRVHEKTAEFEMEFSAKPFILEVDPDFHLFRSLFPEEIPPSIAKVFGAQSQFIVIGSKVEEDKREDFRAAAEMMNKTKTGVIKEDTEVTEDELNRGEVIILGSVAEETSVAGLLKLIKKSPPWERALEDKQNASRVVVYSNPLKSEFSIMVVNGNSGSNIQSITRKLPHYGKYSYLLFHGDQNVEKGTWEVDSSPLLYLF